MMKQILTSSGVCSAADESKSAREVCIRLTTASIASLQMECQSKVAKEKRRGAPASMAIRSQIPNRRTAQRQNILEEVTTTKASPHARHHPRRSLYIRSVGLIPKTAPVTPDASHSSTTGLDNGERKLHRDSPITSRARSYRGHRATSSIPPQSTHLWKSWDYMLGQQRGWTYVLLTGCLGGHLN